MSAVHELPDLLSRLVSIDSVNPDLVPGARGEQELASFVAAWLGERGLEVHTEEVQQGRPNVIAIARGTGGGRSLMLNAHMDTVGAGNMKDPFSPRVQDKRLHGRGALDTKGALAAFMLAAARARELQLSGDVLLTAVIDEEYASLGTAALVKTWHADGAIVGEPTNLEVVIAHKGFTWLELETDGVAAHGSRPDLGVDAIVKMGRVLCGIEELVAELGRGKPHPLLGTGSLHASLIQGGHELATYPSRCRLSVERRTLPGETTAAVEAELQAILDAIAARDPAFKAALRTKLVRSPLEVPPDAPLVQALAQQFAAVTGRPPTLGGMAGWMDSALLTEAGIPSVVFGPAGEGLHADIEWTDLASVVECHEVVLAAARQFCG